jgi:hypothetical protein
MDINLILAALVATNVVMAVRIYKLERNLRSTDGMLWNVMEEGAPDLYAEVLETAKQKFRSP